MKEIFTYCNICRLLYFVIDRRNVPILCHVFYFVIDKSNVTTLYSYNQSLK